MSSNDNGLVQWSDDEFASNAIIESFVPADSDFDLQALLEHWDGNGSKASASIVPFIEQRQFIVLGISRPLFNIRKS